MARIVATLNQVAPWIAGKHLALAPFAPLHNQLSPSVVVMQRIRNMQFLSIAGGIYLTQSLLIGLNA